MKTKDITTIKDLVDYYNNGKEIRKEREEHTCFYDPSFVRSYLYLPEKVTEENILEGVRSLMSARNEIIESNEKISLLILRDCVIALALAQLIFPKDSELGNFLKSAVSLALVTGEVNCIMENQIYKRKNKKLEAAVASVEK